MEGTEETIQFGNTGINRAAAIAMGEEAFKAMYKGKLNWDLDDAWAKINGKTSILMSSTDGNPQYKNKNRKGKPGTGEAKPEAEPEKPEVE